MCHDSVQLSSCGVLFTYLGMKMWRLPLDPLLWAADGVPRGDTSYSGARSKHQL